MRYMLDGLASTLMCLCRLPTAETNLIVATHTCNFIIYSGSRVVWLAKGPTVPVAIAVAAVGQLDAAIVVLDDEGLLSICYLGTAPPSSVLGLSEGREPDWDMLQKRRRELMRVIRDKAPSASSPGQESSQPRYELSLHSQVLDHKWGSAVRRWLSVAESGGSTWARHALSAGASGAGLHGRVWSRGCCRGEPSLWREGVYPEHWQP